MSYESQKRYFQLGKSAKFRWQHLLAMPEVDAELREAADKFLDGAAVAIVEANNANLPSNGTMEMFLDTKTEPEARGIGNMSTHRTWPQQPCAIVFNNNAYNRIVITRKDIAGGTRARVACQMFSPADLLHMDMKNITLYLI